LWAALGGPPQAVRQVRLSGAAGGLPSRFDVSELAAASIAAATLAAAELWAARRGEPLRGVLVDRRLASASFRCEHYLAPQGWKLPAIWDQTAGDFRAADGWIKLHTNYRHHREAALRVLKAAPERQAVAAAVAGWQAEALESAIVEAGGCAAALRTLDAWREHPQGAALAGEPLVAWEGFVEKKNFQNPESPLGGIRVLDLTRVIAGPVGTRCLAAFGADVLRIDPPGFEEIAALLPESTRGKRRAALDLRSEEGKKTFERLVSQADVLVHGYRPGAMEALGFDSRKLKELNPGLVVVRYDAYGWSGPWAGRRGFDSLVQMSTGIAHPGSRAGNDAKPTPLPAQALDHGTGYLIAAAVCRALTDGRASARLSLARTAKLLVDLGAGGDPAAPGLGDVSDLLEASETDWGPAYQVPCPGRIEGYEVKWPVPPGLLGRHQALFG
jgi:hypothetical protein